MMMRQLTRITLRRRRGTWTKEEGSLVHPMVRPPKQIFTPQPLWRSSPLSSSLNGFCGQIQKAMMSSGRKHMFGYLFGEEEEHRIRSGCTAAVKDTTSSDTMMTSDAVTETTKTANTKKQKNRRKRKAKQILAGQDGGMNKYSLDDTLRENQKRFNGKQHKGFVKESHPNNQPKEQGDMDLRTATDTGMTSHVGTNEGETHSNLDEQTVDAAKLRDRRYATYRRPSDEIPPSPPFKEVFTVRMAQGKSVEIQYTNCAKVVNEWVKRRVFATETALLGLDAEWDNSFQRQDYLSKVNKDTRAMLLPVDVIQLATESSVLVYHMSACEDLKQQYRKWKDTQDSFSDSTPSLSGVGPVELPIHLHKLFSSHEYHFVGVGIGQDCAKLKQIGVNDLLCEDIEKDVVSSGASANGFHPQGLAKLARLLVGAKPWKTKSLALSSWATSPLRRKEIMYAARDAYYSRAVALAIRAHVNFMGPVRREGGNMASEYYDYLKSYRFKAKAFHNRRRRRSDTTNSLWVRETDLTESEKETRMYS